MPADRGRDEARASGRTPRIAVIGGGVSGLVAARELIAGGAEVVLLEAEPELGGRIRGERIHGLSFDMGAEAFATRGGTVAAYLEGLGLDEQVVRPEPLGSWLVSEGRALPLPRAGTIGIPVSPLAPASVRVLGLAGALRAALDPLLPRRIGRDAGSVAELVRARLGRRALERAVRPVVLGVYSTDPADLRLSAVPELRAALSRRRSLIGAARDVRASGSTAGGAVAGLRGGMARLIDALAADLESSGVDVRRGTRVERVVRRDGAWRLSCSAAVAPLVCDAVLFAVDEPTALRLAAPALNGDEGTAALGAADIAAAERRAAEVEVVALVVDDARLDTAPRGTGALVAPAAAPSSNGDGGARGSAASPRGAITAKALTHVTAKWPERRREAGPGRHVLRLSYGRAGESPATAQLGDDALRALALRDASRILGLELRSDSLVALRRRCWRTGAPRDGASTRGLAARARAAQCGFAGDWAAGTGLASVIPGAIAEARALLAAATAEDESGREADAPATKNSTNEKLSMQKAGTVST